MSLLLLSKPTECATPRVNPNGNYGLGVIVMGPCRFINCSKCTPVGDVNNGQSCVGGSSTWKSSVPSSQFCCEPKTALKKKKKIKDLGVPVVQWFNDLTSLCGIAGSNPWPGTVG